MSKPRFLPVIAQRSALLSLVAVSAMTLASPVLLAQPAPATATTQRYDIPAGPLGRTLSAVATQAGLSLSFESALTEGLTSSPVFGEYTQTQVLTKLLEGSGLELKLRDDGSYTLARFPATGATLLPYVRVEANEQTQSASEGTGSYTVPITTAATRLPLSPRETPQSVTVITQARILDQDLDTIGKVLRNATGVYVTGAELERGDSYSRGLYVNQYVLDGLPIDLHTGMGGDPTSSSALYDRIEVVRGATGLLSGIGEPSASINLVRKRADSRVLRLAVTGNVGSWSNYEGTIDLATPLTVSGNVRSRIVANYQDTESFLDRYRAKRELYYVTVEADLSDDTRLSVGGDYRRREPRGVTWNGLPPFFSDGSETHFPRSTSVGADWTYWNTESKAVFAGLEHRLSERWSAEVRYAFRDSGFDQELFLMSGFPDRQTGEGMTTFSGKYQDNNKQNSYNFNLNGAFELFGRSHKLNVGYLGMKLWTGDGVSYAYSEDYGAGEVGNFYEWDGSFPRPNFGAGDSGTVTPKETRQNGYYIATQIDLADSLKGVVGARYSSWKLDDGIEPRDFDHLTPYAGLLYDFLTHYTVYVSYTDIFNPQEQKGGNGSFLDPAEGRSYEAGLKASFYDNRLNLSFAVFRSLQDNLAEFGGYFDDENPGPPGQTEYYVGVDGVTVEGVEGEIAGELRPGWNVSLGASHVSIKDRHDDDVNSYLPRTMLRFFTSYRLPGDWNRLTAGFGATYDSSTWSEVWLPGDVVTRFEQDGRVIASLMGRYEFSKNLVLNVNVDNLFDKTYALSGSRLSYGEPRNIQASLRYIW